MGRPIRLLLVIDNLKVGGAERQFVEVASRLDRESFDVSIVLVRGEMDLLPRLAEDRRGRIATLDWRGKWDFPRVVRDLAGVVRRTRPDVVHAWLWYASVTATMALIWAGSRTIGPRFVVSQRCNYDAFFASEGWKGRLRRPLTALRDRWCDRLVVNAGGVARTIAGRLTGGARRVHHIPNAIDVGRVAPLDRPSHEYDLCIVGRLTEQKGHTYLLAALERLAADGVRPRLAVVGTGPLDAALRQEATRRGVAAQVDFLGFRVDVEELVSRAAVAVLPSLFEGSPNTVLEAMALARPVVASGVDGVRDLVLEGSTGCLVPPRDVPALAAAIARLLADRETARRMGEAGRRRVEAEFGFDRVVAAYERIYREVARETCYHPRS